MNFGEKVKGYHVRVLNEREVRASAGILFFFAMISFMNAWLLGNFNYIKIFIIAFFVDFFIRLFISPKYSPSMILGKFAVGKQKVEYVGAPQKQFAWGIGLVLATIMSILVIINDVRGPTNLFICLACLLFLFFESAFGICIGCKVYNLFNKEKAQFCPGGVCEIVKKEPIQKVSWVQVMILILFLLGIFFISNEILETKEPKMVIPAQETNVSDNCVVPNWAIEIGHEEMWKLHNC